MYHLQHVIYLNARNSVTVRALFPEFRPLAHYGNANPAFMVLLFHSFNTLFINVRIEVHCSPSRNRLYHEAHFTACLGYTGSADQLASVRTDIVAAVWPSCRALTAAHALSGHW